MCVCVCVGVWFVQRSCSLSPPYSHPSPLPHRSPKPVEAPSTVYIYIKSSPLFNFTLSQSFFMDLKGHDNG